MFNECYVMVQSFGCQTWDAVFAIQAIIASNMVHEYGTTLRKAHQFIKDSQVQFIYNSLTMPHYRYVLLELQHFA